MSPWEPIHQRKQRVVEAVWRIIHRSGIAAVSLRAVAAEADMVLGSLRNLYPTRVELMADAAARLFQQVGDRVDALEPTGDLIEDGTRAFAELVPLDAQRRVELEVNLALMAEGRSEPVLREIRDHAHREIRVGCERLAAALGTPQAEVSRVARRLHAVVDGVALQLLHQDPADDTAWALDELRQAIATVARRR